MKWSWRPVCHTAVSRTLHVDDTIRWSLKPEAWAIDVIVTVTVQQSKCGMQKAAEVVFAKKYESVWIWSCACKRSPTNKLNQNCTVTEICRVGLHGLLRLRIVQLYNSCTCWSPWQLSKHKTQTALLPEALQPQHGLQPFHPCSFVCHGHSARLFWWPCCTRSEKITGRSCGRTYFPHTWDDRRLCPSSVWSYRCESRIHWNAPNIHRTIETWYRLGECTRISSSCRDSQGAGKRLAGTSAQRCKETAVDVRWETRSAQRTIGKWSPVTAPISGPSEGPPLCWIWRSFYSYCYWGIVLLRGLSQARGRASGHQSAFTHTFICSRTTAKAGSESGEGVTLGVIEGRVSDPMGNSNSEV